MQIRDIIRELAASMADVMPSYGADIDDVHQHVFFATKEEKCKLLLQWLKANQPCMFGRLGASGKKNINMDICVIDGVDLYQDDHVIAATLQAARKAWKEKCLSGHSSAILYYFSSKTLATTMPSTILEQLFQRFAGFIFPEYAPIQSDTIYTESAPLDINGQAFLFKAGINFFHTTAHLTPNHDRRIPGGIVISVNSVGHYANMLVGLGLADTLQDAINTVQRVAWFSIGNGGIGDEQIKSCSWHNINPQQTANLPSRPKHIPENFDTTTYSALYQTDVLIPAELTAHHTPLGSTAHQIWPNLKIEYFSAAPCTFGDINFGMFHGYPIDKRFIQFNPWPPLHAENNGDFVY